MRRVGGVDALGLLEVAGTRGAAAHFEGRAAFEQAIDDGLGQVAIMPHLAPGRQRSVVVTGAAGDGVDDPIEHVGRGREARREPDERCG